MNTVVTGQEMQKTYALELKRFKLALEHDFCLEAVCIAYAMIEDRLVAFLHHAGVVSRNAEELKVNKHAYPYMRRLLGVDDQYAIRVKDISVKMEIVRQLLAMTEEKAKSIDEAVAALGKKRAKDRTTYMTDLYQLIDRTVDRVAVETILQTDGRLDEWRKQRNQLIHALLRKTPASEDDAKRQCAMEGGALFRSMDDMLVKPFKKHDRLRTKYNIQ